MWLRSSRRASHQERCRCDLEGLGSLANGLCSYSEGRADEVDGLVGGWLLVAGKDEPPIEFGEVWLLG